MATILNANPDGLDSLMKIDAYKGKPGVSPFIIVGLRSNVKTGLWAHQKIPLNVVGSESEMKKMIEAVVNKLIEHQANWYGDNHSVRDCVETALELWEETVKQQN